MRFKVSIEKQSDGTYIAYNTNVEGLSLSGTGSTVGEARQAFLEAMKEVAETYREGESVPKCLATEPVFKFDLASLFEYYNIINVSAFARYVGINDTLMRQYKRGGTYISDLQLKKIEDGIHALGRDFSHLKLV